MERRESTDTPAMSREPFQIKPDVQCLDHYFPGDCPNCGRRRLEMYVDSGGERAVGIRCEKCYAQWVLDPANAAFHGDLSDDDPLNPIDPAEDDWLRGKSSNG